MPSFPTTLCRFVPAVSLFFARPAAAYWNLESAFSAPGNWYEANRFGSGLEMSGSTIAVGAEATDEAEKPDVGAVYTYERDAANQWSLTQIFRYPEEPAGSGIGHTIALDGNVLLVPVTSATTGRVIVYQRTAAGAQWTKAQTLTGDQADEWFGKSVAVRGNTVVVGAEQSGSGVQNQDRPGAAYVFTRAAPGAAWTRAQKITAPPSAGVNSNFGSDVELDGELLTVGARSLSLTANQSGVTFVYRGSPGAYTLVQTLAPDSFYSGNQGWESTSLRNGLLLIGSPDEKNPDNTAQAWGAAFAYDAASGILGPLQKIMPANRTGTPRFGSAIAAAGDVMAIGVPVRNLVGGAVYLWGRTGGGAWTTSGGVISRAGVTDAFFGHRVAMNEPNRVAIAAPGRNDGLKPGEVYVYREGDAGPFVMATTSPASHTGTYRARLNAVVRSSVATTTFFFDYGRTTAYELGTVSALPESVSGSDAVYVSRTLDGRQFPPLEINTVYHYRVRGGGLAGLDTTFTTASFDPALGDAVEASALNWESSGQTRWQSQAVTTWDGTDALKAGSVLPNNTTRLETMVFGPGTLSFRWKVSCEPVYNLLSLLDNDERIRYIFGNVDWKPDTVLIAPGTHRITWEFARSTGSSQYLDTAWVDAVTWSPANPAGAWTQWRNSVFTASQLANAAVSGPTADPDGDGLKNVVEAHFGSSPLATGMNPLTATADTSTFTLRWPEANPPPGTVATPEWSPNGIVWLVSGQSLNGIPARTITVSYAGGNLKQAILASAGLARGFLRLRVGTL